MVLEGQVHGFVARINSKLGSIDEAGPVQFFLDINQHVRFLAVPESRSYEQGLPGCLAASFVFPVGWMTSQLLRG